MYNPMSISYIRNKENITFQIILKLRILCDLSNYNLTNINSFIVRNVTNTVIVTYTLFITYSKNHRR